MSDAFYTMLGIVLPIVIVQGVQVWQTSRNAKKSEAGREEIKAQVSEVKDHLETVKMQAVRSKEELDMARTAGVREGYVGGIEEGRKQSTGPGAL